MGVALLAMSADSVGFKDKWRQRLNRVLPHEWVFSAFLAITGLRLLTHDGARGWSLIFFACLACAVVMIAWTERNSSPWRWRVRLSTYFVMMGAAFYSMRIAVPLMGMPQADGLLLQWDRDLLGETPAVTWDGWMYPWLEDTAMAGYLFFFYYLMAGPFHYCFRDLALFRKCMVGLFTIYGIAFMGYTLLPAAGPHLTMTFAHPLHGPLLLDSTLNLVNAGSNAVDVFPSMHMAATLYLLLFDWRHWRRRFWWVLAPVTVLWTSTLYLRFHYFVDLVAGAAIALIGWWVAERYEAAHRLEPGEDTLREPQAISRV